MLLRRTTLCLSLVAHMCTDIHTRHHMLTRLCHTAAEQGYSIVLPTCITHVHRQTFKASDADETVSHCSRAMGLMALLRRTAQCLLLASHMCTDRHTRHNLRHPVAEQRAGWRSTVLAACISHVHRSTHKAPHATNTVSRYCRARGLMGQLRQ